MCLGCDENAREGVAPRKRTAIKIHGGVTQNKLYRFKNLEVQPDVEIYVQSHKPKHFAFYEIKCRQKTVCGSQRALMKSVFRAGRKK